MLKVQSVSNERSANFTFYRGIDKGDVLLEFSSVKWVLNEDHTLYWNVLGTLLLQNFVLVNSYFYEFFVEQTSVVI